MQPARRFLIDASAFQRELHYDSVELVPGVEVTWIYRPQRRRHEIHLVAAEVVQVSELRIRICARMACGTSVLRWVHLKNLRLRAPGEPASPYPEAS